jgi:hypothetical protein
MAEETYLGDGLYARYNGQEIWLRAPREEGDHEVCLDTRMLEQLQKLVDNFDPTPSDDGRAWPQADNE